MRRETPLKLALVTFPSLSWVMLVLVHFVRWRLGWASGGTGRLAEIARLSSWAATLIALFVLFHALRGRHRAFARFSLIYSATLAALLVWLSEVFFPLPTPPTNAQKLLIEQLRRRNEELTTPYHGSLLVPGRANDLGWRDRDHAFAKKGKRILFIGDSMLEVRSRQRLASRIEARLPVEVVNLSIEGSDPLDYRFRLHEYAFDYQPDHIFVFLYGPNDFALTPPFEPYRPPPVRVTGQTLASAPSTGLPPATLKRLRQLIGHTYLDRKSLLEAVGGQLSRKQQHLLYTLAVAYSDAETRRPLQSTRSRFVNLATRLVECGTTTDGPFFPDPQWWSSPAFEQKQAQIYRLPQPARLPALAQLYAESMGVPPEQVEQFLRSQTPQLQTWLTGEPDKLWFLAIPLNRLSPTLSPPNPPQPIQLEVYERLLTEMTQTAQTHGCKLTYVFIPTPGEADPDFNAFWANSPPTEASAPAYRAVLKQIQGRLSVIDLATPPNQFRGGYWPLDGHWTDHGNEVAADILVDFLRSERQ